MSAALRQTVLLLEKFGGTEGFVVSEALIPEPGPGEVLVKVLAASVQFTDVMLRKGRYPDLKEKPPLVLGYDLVGEVVRLGADVESLHIGQRVADLTTTGCYAQFRILKANRVTPVDPSLDPGEATTLVLSWTTAYQLLHRDAKVKSGNRLLVIGAAGAVGQALVVLGQLAGCSVWGTARARHADLCANSGRLTSTAIRLTTQRWSPEGSTPYSTVSANKDSREPGARSARAGTCRHLESRLPSRAIFRSHASASGLRSCGCGTILQAIVRRASIPSPRCAESTLSGFATTWPNC